MICIHRVGVGEEINNFLLQPRHYQFGNSDISWQQTYILCYYIYTQEGVAANLVSPNISIGHIHLFR